MKQILVTDPIHTDAITFLEKEGFEIIQLQNPDEGDILKYVINVEAIICRTSSKITKRIIEAGVNLKCIGVHATGWDHIDVQTATEHNILLLGYPSNSEELTNIYDGSFVPVAEYVLMTMLAVSKKLIEANQSMKSEQWDKYKLSGSELYGKTLGIIGLGRIGSLVAERARAFGMEVIAFHPRLNAEGALKRSARLASFDDILKKSDFITIHIPKTQENINLINADSFNKMKKHPVLINTSRAAIVNEKDLEDAIEANKIKAAVLDVFEGAPNEVNWSLVKNSKVIATPHIAGVSDESLKRVSTYITSLVTDYVKYGKINGQINTPPTVNI